jgi:glycine/D-amino acid oxidase-like deaminating enzyme
VYFTREAAKVGALSREFRARKKAGLPGRWLSSRALYRKTGIRAQAAILTTGNAQVNPLVACYSLLEAARARGAKVFERSRARRIVTSKSGVRVETARATIHAGIVVVASGYAAPELRGRLGRFRMRDTYVIAMPRHRPPSSRDKRVPKTMAWDTDRPYHYLRWTEDGRLLVGGEDTHHRAVKGARGRLARAERRLVDYLHETCPELAKGKPEFGWEGLFAETPDGLPFIGHHSRFPRHLFALGYGGNGMTASFLAGTLLLRLYQAGPSAAKARKIIKLFAFRRGHG